MEMRAAMTFSLRTSVAATLNPLTKCISVGIPDHSTAAIEDFLLPTDCDFTGSFHSLIEMHQLVLNGKGLSKMFFASPLRLAWPTS